MYYELKSLREKLLLCLNIKFLFFPKFTFLLLLVFLNFKQYYTTIIYQYSLKYERNEICAGKYI